MIFLNWLVYLAIPPQSKSSLIKRINLLIFEYSRLIIKHKLILQFINLPSVRCYFHSCFLPGGFGFSTNIPFFFPFFFFMFKEK